VWWKVREAGSDLGFWCGGFILLPKLLKLTKSQFGLSIMRRYIISYRTIVGTTGANRCKVASADMADALWVPDNICDSLLP